MTVLYSYIVLVDRFTWVTIHLIAWTRYFISSFQELTHTWRTQAVATWHLYWLQNQTLLVSNIQVTVSQLNYTDTSSLLFISHTPLFSFKSTVLKQSLLFSVQHLIQHPVTMATDVSL